MTSYNNTGNICKLALIQYDHDCKPISHSILRIHITKLQTGKTIYILHCPHDAKSGGINLEISTFSHIICKCK